MNTTPAQDKIAEFGLDAICAWITNGESMTALAQYLDVGFGRLHAWLAADPERSARAKEARTISAQRWDEEAVRRLDEATDTLSLARAKELAHHYRWRASKIAPAQYGDKLQHANAAGDGDQVTKVQYSWSEPTTIEHQPTEE